FVALSNDAQGSAPCAEVNLLTGECTEFPRTQSCMQEHDQHGLIAQCASGIRCCHERMFFVIRQMTWGGCLLRDTFDLLRWIKQRTFGRGCPGEIAFEAHKGTIDRCRLEPERSLQVGAIACDERGGDERGSKGLPDLFFLPPCLAPSSKVTQIAEIVA